MRGVGSEFSTGFNGYVRTMVAFDDGSGPALYAGGSFTTAGGASASYIAKWNGTSWSAWLPGSGMNGPVQALAVFDDGSGPALYAGGRLHHGRRRRRDSHREVERHELVGARRRAAG